MARFHIDLQMRWGDQDAYGHVNNVSQARYFEEARVRSFFVPGTREETGLQGFFRQDTEDGLKMFVASQTIDYLHGLEYQENGFEIEMWISKIGGASLTLNAELISPAQGNIVTTRCKTVAVVVDGTTLKPVRISDAARAVATEWMDEPFKVRKV